jgi:hypothetical protein
MFQNTAERNASKEKADKQVMIRMEVNLLLSKLRIIAPVIAFNNREITNAVLAAFNSDSKKFNLQSVHTKV